MVLNKIVYGTVGLLLLFLMASSVFMPFFSSSWRYCQARQWNCGVAGVYTNCTSRYQDPFNTTVVDPSTGTHTEGGLTDPVDTDTTQAACTHYCLNCETAGGYRTSAQGLLLLVLVIALIGFGVRYLPRMR